MDTSTTIAALITGLLGVIGVLLSVGMAAIYRQVRSPNGEPTGLVIAHLLTKQTENHELIVDHAIRDDQRFDALDRYMHLTTHEQDSRWAVTRAYLGMLLEAVDADLPSELAARLKDIDGEMQRLRDKREHRDD